MDRRDCILCRCAMKYAAEPPPLGLCDSCFCELAQNLGYSFDSYWDLYRENDDVAIVKQIVGLLDKRLESIMLEELLKL